MKNTGKGYERFVAGLQQALLDAERFTNQNNIKVEIDKKITDSCGIERQFDIYWEYEIGGFLYRTVIECKDYASSVSVDKIDALIGKTKDIPDLKPVFATKTGYQSGARLKAEHHKIDLLIVREHVDDDWVDENGMPLIKKVFINMQINMPVVLNSFVPKVDGEWLRANTSFDASKQITFSGMNDEIFIDDFEKGDRYSLHQLGNKLAAIHDGEYGNFEKSEVLHDAYLCINEIRIKLSGFDLKYSISQPATDVIEIDFSKEMIGVIEYLQKGIKKSIFRNGIVR